MTCQDLIIIGAGPAGLAAAALAARHGASATLIDEQAAPGGQIYRNVSGATGVQKDILGPDYAKGQALVEELDAQPVARLSGAVVWDADDNGQLTFSQGGTARRMTARHILIATGATERPMPVPGWTLPGVMTAGAAQILMKTPGLVPRDAVLAGSGPLLYLVAAQMIAAGSPPRALVETQGRANHVRALAHLGGALRGWRALAKGAALLARLKRSGVRRYTGAEGIEILGGRKAEGLRFIAAGGREHELTCSTVLLHQGVVPNTQITRALRLSHSWNGLQRCFHPDRNLWGRTSNPKYYVAGDGGGIGGAAAAEEAGRLAALDILFQGGRITEQNRDQMAAAPRRAHSRELSARPFLDTLYQPPGSVLRPADPVTICRCEEVTAGDIRRYASLGCTGPNQTKAFGRCGMGPCQGRYCSLTVTELLSEATGASHQEVGAYRIRTPLKPMSLGEVASLAVSDQEATRESG